MIFKQRSNSVKGARTAENRRSPVIISHLVLVFSGMLLMLLLTQWFLPPDFNPAKQYSVIFSIYGGPNGGQPVSNRWTDRIVLPISGKRLVM